MKYQESDLPEGTHIRVSYLSRLRSQRVVGVYKIPLWHTTARLLDNDNNLLAIGTSSCSNRDQPCKKIGRAIAVGRALKSYAQG